MDDLISRQATLDLARDICIPTKDGSIYRHRCIDPDAIRELPSAQPETEERTEKSAQNVPNDDLISRKMTIEELRVEFERIPTTVIRAIERLNGLPSAQSERKTGKMMTLDEAIIHCEEVADRCVGAECEMEHRQLATWLKELKQRRTEQRWIPCSEKLLEPCDTKTENVLNSNWTIYSDRVKTELETQGITTRELADKLNITPITMHRYLKGDRIPRGPVIAQTATVLNVTCDYLVGLSDDPHKTSEEK